MNLFVEVVYTQHILFAALKLMLVDVLGAV